jgi:co-chaperonin GroES (HSP10)
MTQMNVEDFERTYADPVPVNGAVLVEVVEKDPTRTTKGGIVVQEDAMSTGIVINPYLVVLALADDIDEAIKGKVEVGDIIQISTNRVNAFLGKDMVRLGLVASEDISAVHQHLVGTDIKITKKTVKPKQAILGGEGRAQPKHGIIGGDGKIIAAD